MPETPRAGIRAAWRCGDASTALTCLTRAGKAGRRPAHLRAWLSGPDLHDAVAAVVARHLDGARDRAWIIGSEASGTARPGADFDIALASTGPIDLLTLARLRDALEALPTLRASDLLDLARTEPAFRREALRHSIRLLPPPVPAQSDVEG